MERIIYSVTYSEMCIVDLLDGSLPKGCFFLLFFSYFFLFFGHLVLRLTLASLMLKVQNVSTKCTKQSISS